MKILYDNFIKNMLKIYSRQLNHPNLVQLYGIVTKRRPLIIEPLEHLKGRGVVMFNVAVNNISVILWWSVLLVEETGVPRENHQPAAKTISNIIYFPFFVKSFLYHTPLILN
jgi:hypothetical protein